ncbi:hypothetical protein B0H14DRAFT_2628708 [Mycena olivaceomarginata]|nr:hypothetical protein B0H14DRAFT_2628708 [Mycena olivaceomarginata]
MAQYDDLFGCVTVHGLVVQSHCPPSSILIGTWFVSMLYGVVICKTWQYLLLRASGDPQLLLRKGLLICCTLSSALATVAQLANVYYASLHALTWSTSQPTVTFWGNSVLVEREYWPVPVYVLANTVTGTMVNAFLIHRLYRLYVPALSPRRHYCPLNFYWDIPELKFYGSYSSPRFVVVIGLAGAIMVAVVIAMSGAISWTGFEDGNRWADLDRGHSDCNVSIASALLWKLTTMNTSPKEPDSRIRRLVERAIETGATTSTMAVATAGGVLHPRHPRKRPCGVPLLIGPLYMLTLLYNFNLGRQRDDKRQPEEYQQSGTTYGRHGAIVNCTEYDVPGRYEHEYPCVFDDVAPAEVWLTHLSIPRALPDRCVPHAHGNRLDDHGLAFPECTAFLVSLNADWDPRYADGGQAERGRRGGEVFVRKRSGR